jgi:hypothetical protein
MKKKIIAITATAVAVAITAGAVAYSDVVKRSEPIRPNTSAYGATVDESKKGSTKALSLDGKELSLVYKETHNNSTVPLKKRSDKYGTYDIYVDDQKNEYLFLVDSDFICAFHFSREAMNQGKHVTEDEALEIAKEYMEGKRDNAEDYVLYDVLRGGSYYSFEFYLPVDGYRSDDNLRVWVTKSGGEIMLFQEFYYKRYDGVKVDSKKVEKAEQKIVEKLGTIKDGYGNPLEWEFVEKWITINDKGKLELRYGVDLKVPHDGGAVLI